MLLARRTRLLSLATVAACLAVGTMSLSAPAGPAGAGTVFEIEEWVSCLAFSPDGKTLACGKVLRPGLTLRDSATGKELSKAEAGPGHARFTTHVAFSPDGRQLASVHFDQEFSPQTLYSVLLWDVTAGNELRLAASLPLPKHGYTVYSESLGYLTFSPDGRMLAARYPGDETLVWETASGKERLRLATQGLVVAFGDGGRTLICVSRDGRVQHWDLATRRCVASGGDTGRKDFLFVLQASASADGSIVALTDGASVVIKDTRSGKTLRRFDDVSAVLSPDGKTLLGGRPGTRDAILFDAGTGKERARLNVDGAPYLAKPAFSPNGKSLALAWEKSVAVCDVDKLTRADRRGPLPLPLEATLTSQQDAYALDLGGKTAEEFARQINELKDENLPPAPKVDLVLNLRNTSGKPVTLADPDVIRIYVYLVGDGAMNHPEKNGLTLYGQRELKPVTLAPGAAYSIPIKSLDTGNDRRSYWLLPGEYAVHAGVSACVSPAPNGALKLADGSGHVHVPVPPLRVKVVAAKK